MMSSRLRDDDPMRVMGLRVSMEGRAVCTGDEDVGECTRCGEGWRGEGRGAWGWSTENGMRLLRRATTGTSSAFELSEVESKVDSKLGVLAPVDRASLDMSLLALRCFLNDLGVPFTALALRTKGRAGRSFSSDAGNEKARRSRC
jgi:hypothetical protein